MDPVEQRRVTKAFLPAARRVANKVDPLDLIKMGASKDEYDDLVAEAARWLARDAADLQLRLAAFVRSRYGLAPDKARIEKLANELRTAWRGVR
jgi:hypothetical protein